MYVETTFTCLLRAAEFEYSNDSVTKVSYFSNSITNLNTKVKATTLTTISVVPLSVLTTSVGEGITVFSGHL